VVVFAKEHGGVSLLPPPSPTLNHYHPLGNPGAPPRLSPRTAAARAVAVATLTTSSVLDPKLTLTDPWLKIFTAGYVLVGIGILVEVARRLGMGFIAARAEVLEAKGKAKGGPASSRPVGRLGLSRFRLATIDWWASTSSPIGR
jgi:hypothetical protein